MKSENRSQAFLRKRKMLLVLPLLVIPFLTMAFWALGGGTATPDKTPVASQGLNLNLPSSKVSDDKDDNKLSFYDKARRDSAKLEEWMRNDPYYKARVDTNQAPVANALQQITEQTSAKYNQPLNSSPYETGATPPEQKLMQKLATLQKELDKPAVEKAASKADEQQESDAAMTEQMNRLQSMMEGMQASDNEDPEMKQIGTTLDKILDIQHPERVKNRLKEATSDKKSLTYPVSKSSQQTSVSLFGFQNRPSNKGFLSLEEEIKDTVEDAGIEAEVLTSQTITNGSVVRLRLLTSVYINGKLVPKGTYANGLASLNNERLEVEISSIRTGNSIMLVKLTGYDMDGLQGLYVPGAISRDVAKQSADNSLQLLELSSMDPSMKAQLASAGISSVKNLLSRKVKQVKVFVKAGYKVLLKNTSVQ